jgi:hypothetical protein
VNKPVTEKTASFDLELEAEAGGQEVATVEQEVEAVENLFASASPTQALAVAEPIAEQVPAIIQDGPGALLATINAMARDPAVDVAKFEAILNIQERLEAREERMETRRQERAFKMAFVEMQPFVPVVTRTGNLVYPPKKEGDPPIKVAKYAEWENIDKAMQPILRRFGFGLRFDVKAKEGGGLLISTILEHIEGHTEQGSPFPVPMDKSGGKNDIQAYGSALSYGMRYTSKAAGLFKTEGEDDDGAKGGWVGVTPDQVDELTRLIENAVFANGKAATERAFIRHAASGPDGNPISHFTEMRRGDFERVANTLRGMQRKEDTQNAKGNS